jgi:hypothetical protein
MSKFCIVGAGQSGLQLGLGLLKEGHDVTIISDRDPEEIYNGRVASSQCMFHDPLRYEREVGVTFWDDAPWVEGIGFNIPHPEVPGETAVSWAHRLNHPAQAIDQRVKFPRLMEFFEDQGGAIIVETADIDCLERYSRTYDLVIVAAGKGEIAQMFMRDDDRSVFSAPQRALALTYVHGMRPRDEFSAVSFNLIPGVGEYFVFPSLTKSGPCEIMVMEGVPGGPMDCWKGLSPQEHFEQALNVLDAYLPWEADRCRETELTDDGGVLAGRFPPTIRKPVAYLPSGTPVLGMADVVVLNDPITGQGSNNASRCAHSYLHSILSHEGPFDADFMQNCFEEYYDYAQDVVRWTNALLTPPTEHMQRALQVADESPDVAHRLVEIFNDPKDSAWFLEEEVGKSYLDQATRVYAPTV